MNKFTKPTPPNRMCFWYRGGQTSREPSVAIVTHDDGGGILCLSVFTKQWSRHECRTSVRHKDDPFLKRRPECGKDNGCWDYLPSCVPNSLCEGRAAMSLTAAAARVNETVSKIALTQAIEKAPPKPLSSADKDIIASLAAQGKSAVEIAAQLSDASDEEWSHQRVNAILRQMKPTD